jgi:predicted nucleic acid-binding protein
VTAAVRPAFVDAGAWIALADRTDAHHGAARAIHERLTAARRPLVTTNLVVAEAFVLIRRSGGHAAAMRFLEALRSAGRLTVVYAHGEHHEQAEDILRRFADQDFSLADAVSFAIMREKELTEAFAFDAHFPTAGFRLLTA